MGVIGKIFNRLRRMREREKVNSGGRGGVMDGVFRLEEKNQCKFSHFVCENEIG
jgi:hypothetical protein